MCKIELRRQRDVVQMRTYRTEWYDFCMVNYENMGQSPALILGFFNTKLLEFQHHL